MRKGEVCNNHGMQALRNARHITRFVLVWFALSIGAGLQVWNQPTPDTSVRVLGIQPQNSVILLPGFQRPGTGAWGPQPMLRFTVGPAF